MLVFGVRIALVGAVSHTLYLPVLVACGSVERNDGILAVARRVVFIYYGTSREDVSEGVSGN